MNYQEFLFQKMAEECAEIAQAAIKINIFGLDSTDPKVYDSPTNLEALRQEYSDLIAILSKLNDLGIYVHPDQERVELKQTKLVDQFYEYERKDY